MFVADTVSPGSVTPSSTGNPLVNFTHSPYKQHTCTAFLFSLSHAAIAVYIVVPVVVIILLIIIVVTVLVGIVLLWMRNRKGQYSCCHAHKGCITEMHKCD